MIKVAFFMDECENLDTIREFQSQEEMTAYEQGVSDMMTVTQYHCFSVVTLENLVDFDFSEEFEKDLIKALS